ncbi:hypothetical protein ACWPKO_01770 [Coraliomargarita sp. W4R53]
MTPQSIRLKNGALFLEGPKGIVRIQSHPDSEDGIVAQYQGKQLVNGSALAYSEQLLDEAIEYTKQFPFPWEIESDGTQRITNHKQFYEQTFNSDLQGIEMLRHWIGDHAKPTGCNRHD